ncbi:protein NPAT isoform X1 [Xenopus laevis]|uniref:Protein NPAT isoform X1 n=1 Tax=Xenopus laevis TaxID=8355 RepID=A0A8J1MCN8_XENLA|nr:protein NPAT isoform X1 [Xenopus laevis]
MLLPSDVARLVLGYLQQEKLSSTCRSFILESPNLREYAEHYTDEGSIPGCVLSLFGKNLTTILNEYIAMKAKENKEEIPVMVSALWKKLDHTLSQIRSMQNCLVLPTSQKVRTRYGIQDLRHQRMLTSHAASTGSAVALQQTSTPIAAKQVMLRSFTSQSASQTIVSPLCSGQSTIQCTNSPATESKGETLQNSALSDAEKKQTSSPMRRKTDCQRRRRAAPLNSSSATHEGETEGNVDSLQDLIDGNFPQLVIENAREKILSNKSLQEKLAENINKFLGSDTATQASKLSEGGALEQYTSIDEILGLQGGEIHMSEEAIHDILEQTELDPDFQELYDLFACSSTKPTKLASRDPSLQTEGVATSSIRVANDNLEPMESSFDASDTSHSSNHSEVAAEQKKDGRSQLVVPSPTPKVTESTGLPSKVQEMPISASERQSMSDRSVESKKSIDSIIILDNTGSDTVIESNEEVQVTSMEVGISQSQDVDMNVLHTEVIGADCQLAVEQGSLNMLTIDLTVPNSKEETPKTRTYEKASEAKKSSPLKDEVQALGSRRLERNKSEGAEEPCTTESQNIVVLVSIGSTVTESNLLNQRGDLPATPRKTDTPTDNTVSEQMQAESSITSKELKVVQKQASKTPPHPMVPPISPSIKGSSSDSDGSSLPLEVSSSVGVSTPVNTSNVEQNCSDVSSVDPSQIITLSFITEDIAEDAELTKAVKSISERSNSALLLSPFHKPQESGSIVSIPGPTSETLTLLADPREVVNVSGDVATGVKPAEDCTIISLPGASNLSTDGGIIQLMPATSSSFAPSGSFFISTCNTGGAQQSNIMVVPSNCAPASTQKQPCHFQTPPRPHSVYTVGQAISPKLSQGSTFILASAVQPVLPGVMGMFPVSVVGQSSNTFTTPSHQVLHVPVSQGVPKLPLPPKSQKPVPPRTLASAAEKQGTAATTDSGNRKSSSRMQRSENVDKNLAAMSQNKPEERQTSTTNPSTKGTENHKRVLCFENTAANRGTPNTKSLCNSAAPQNKDKVETMNTSSSSLPAKQNNKDSGKADKTAPSTEANSKCESVPSKQPVVPATKDLSGDKKPVAVASSPDVLGGVMANKENMLQKENKKQELPEVSKKSSTADGAAGNLERTVQAVHETGRKHATLPSILRRTKLSTERMCPPSPLTKQASDLLQSMQFNSPNAKHFSGGDLPIPRTPGSGIDDRLVDSHQDHMKTPKSKRYPEDGGTPKPMLPPATPELPACSPASETGSENSVNMAAHTLMILSRATLAKTDGSSPLKDNTQQIKLSKNSSKKRKLDEPDEYGRRPHKKELMSPSAILKRKKMKKHRKKSTDDFPAGMDVDKFLMSLHYDE